SHSVSSYLHALKFIFPEGVLSYLIRLECQLIVCWYDRFLSRFIRYSVLSFGYYLDLKCSNITDTEAHLLYCDYVICVFCKAVNLFSCLFLCDAKLLCIPINKFFTLHNFTHVSFSFCSQ